MGLSLVVGAGAAREPAVSITPRRIRRAHVAKGDPSRVGRRRRGRASRAYRTLAGASYGVTIWLSEIMRSCGPEALCTR